jgi:hypothetical protein
MNKLNSFFAVVFIVSGFAIQTLAQVSFASWAKLSSDAPKDIDSRKYPVPSKDEVGIPPYPGAVISSISTPSTDTIKYKQEVLPFINLVTNDTPENVINFYKRNLTKEKGWNYSEELRTFVKGPVGSISTGFIPSVAIRDENGDHFDLIYVNQDLKNELKSRIEITYKPNKQTK